MSILGSVCLLFSQSNVVRSIVACQSTLWSGIDAEAATENYPCHGDSLRGLFVLHACSFLLIRLLKWQLMQRSAIAENHHGPYVVRAASCQTGSFL